MNDSQLTGALPASPPKAKPSASWLNWSRLYDNSERLFWTLHSLGWLGYLVFSYLGSFIDDMRDVWVFVITLNAYAGWLLTFPLRYIFRWSRQQKALVMVLSIAIATYLVCLLYTSDAADD